MNKLGIHRKCLKLVFVMITSNQIFDNRGCTDFWRVLKPEMEKMGTLKKNGDQKTNVGAVWMNNRKTDQDIKYKKEEQEA